MDTDHQPPRISGLAELVHTALFDQGGELREGAFVDHWVSFADEAVDTICARVSPAGFHADDLTLVVDILRRSDTPSERGLHLLERLRKLADPIITQLRSDPSPRVRGVAAGASARLGDRTRWVEDIVAPEREVRLAALDQLAKYRGRESEVQETFRGLIDDPDVVVRRIAIGALKWFRLPEVQAALVRRLAVDDDEGIRALIVRKLLAGIRSEGIHHSVADGIIPSVRQLAIAALNHELPELRTLAASAMERLRGEDVADAMLDRLEVERDEKVRETLVLFFGFHLRRARALSVLLPIVANDPSSVMRGRVAFILPTLGEDSLPVLEAAMTDPVPEVRRAAAMGLGALGRSRHLPILLRELARPESKRSRREIESAVRDVVVRMAHSPAHPSDEPSSATIQRLIDGLSAEGIGNWPTRVCKEVLNALPLDGNAAYIFALRPDREIIAMDMDSARHATDPVTDLLTRFAVMLKGADRYPELAALIPPPPKGTALCRSCEGRGYTQAGEACPRCGGLGWRVG